jgi:hypothetical protein
MNLDQVFVVASLRNGSLCIQLQAVEAVVVFDCPDLGGIDILMGGRGEYFGLDDRERWRNEKAQTYLDATQRVTQHSTSNNQLFMNGYGALPNLDKQ